MMTLATLTPPPAPRPRPFRWSREAFARLGELGFFDGRRVERIRGEIVETSAVNWPHALTKTLTARALGAAFAGVGWVNDQNPLPTPDSDPLPDVAVIPGDPRDYADHPPSALLVVEVADSTLDYDTTTKAEVYATAGVADYWVVDVAGRRVIVFRDPHPIPDGGAAYRTRTEFAETDAVAPLAAPHAAVTVADLLP